MYFTYILKSQKNGRFYTGSTQDVHKRIIEHNAGKSSYDKLNRPFVLLHYEEHGTRIEA